MPDTDDGDCCSLLLRFQNINNNNNKCGGADAYAFLFKQKIKHALDRTFIYRLKKLFHFVFGTQKQKKEIPQQIRNGLIKFTGINLGEQRK